MSNKRFKNNAFEKLKKNEQALLKTNGIKVDERPTGIAKSTKEGIKSGENLDRIKIKPKSNLQEEFRARQLITNNAKKNRNTIQASEQNL